ncbi:uncharacterized protein LOC122533840 [Frieseomelitta varia]|uniref:uncharacterized protein LOC122533840 n=1 Tax=Frieseomelitta varia TaxID=561572 RepID=UPI001CB6B4E1|nr:uncharacterized protein LOC122533840 [Frieseomelitta varia]
MTKFKYKELLDAIWDDWATNRTKDEFDIMEQYAVKADIFCRIHIGFSFTCAVVCFLEPSLMPIILDVILPKNESRGIVYIFPAYYIIDDRKYRTLITVHIACLCFSSFYVFTGCDTSYMFIVQHACGQLAVTGYRLKNAILDLSNVKDPSDVQNESYRRVLHSIRAHQHAINYVKTIDDTHSVYLFVGMIFIIIEFSVTLVKISSYMEISAQYLKDGFFFFCQIVHLGFISLQGQFIVNSNDEVVQSIHDASWYNANKRTQLLFVLVMRSCLNSPTISAGGLLTMNLENFSKIMKTSFSYFTVLKSV